MGLKDSFNLNSKDSTGNAPGETSLAVALMQELQLCPGGVSGVLESLRRNGLSDLIKTWANGLQNTATPQQVQQGLRGIGLIEGTAARAGVSLETAAAAIAALLPALIRHFAPCGHAPQPVRGDQFLVRNM